MPASFAAAAGRRAAERLMTDECEIRTPAEVRFNPVTRANDVVAGDELLYAGKCRARAQNVSDQEKETGEATVSTWAIVVSIPFGATHQGDPVPVAPDCVVKLTKSADPMLTDKPLRVRQVPAGTHLTARRMVCEVYGG